MLIRTREPALVAGEVCGDGSAVPASNELNFAAAGAQECRGALRVRDGCLTGGTYLLHRVRKQEGAL